MSFKPLTPKQRGYIAQLAKQAHTYLTGNNAIDEPFDTWRRREAMQATSGFTISEAPRRCFDDLERHFLVLAGKTGKAFDRTLGPDNAERQQRHTIKELAEQVHVSDPEHYARSLDSHQLKGVIINLKKRLRAQTADLSA